MLIESQIFKPSFDRHDFKQCEFCHKILCRELIEIDLKPNKNIIKMDYEECTCKRSVEYWKDFNRKTLETMAREENIRCINEFNKIVNKLFQQSKMGYALKNKSFENFTTNSHTEKTVENIKKYTKDILSGEGKRGLIIVGKNGVGKTHLACSIANKLIRSHIPIMYGTLINLLSQIKHSYDEESLLSEIQYIEMYSTVNVLTIDDLGKEKPSAWAIEKLFTIVNNRYENNLPIIITTSYSQETLLRRLSKSGEFETVKSIISRLYEMCIEVNIAGENYRMKEKKLTTADTNVN